jgi:hypothetical protein
MSTIEIRVTEAVTVANFTESVANGNVQFYRVRGNGTTRHIPVFAEGTEAFEKAEWVAEQREEGKTMKALATELHMSVPSVRRLLNSYLLSDEVAGYEPEDIEELLAEATVAEPVAEGNDLPEAGEVLAPSEEEGEIRCTECNDVITASISGKCIECYSKVEAK